ncbi:hypothetical protein ABWJ92_02795 [Streptomyces sp. NPDC000609]
MDQQSTHGHEDRDHDIRGTIDELCGPLAPSRPRITGHGGAATGG